MADNSFNARFRCHCHVILYNFSVCNSVRVALLIKKSKPDEIPQIVKVPNLDICGSGDVSVTLSVMTWHTLVNKFF